MRPGNIKVGKQRVDDFLLTSTAVTRMNSGEDLLVGALIYANHDTLNFEVDLFSAYWDKESSAEFYPYQLREQKFMVAYPWLAYEGPSPGKHEIIVANLVQKLPQRVYNLGDKRLVSFVDAAWTSGFEDCFLQMFGLVEE